MNGDQWVRQTHRWTSVVFTLAVVANFIARALRSGEPPMLLTYSPLPPLFLQLFTGLYLFALPYIRAGRPRAAPDAMMRR